MIRFFISTVIGVLIGIMGGVALGWTFPLEYKDSTLSELAPAYQDQYTLMIAAGFVEDRDVNGAFERLQLLDVDSVPAHVQAVAERYITSSRDLDDIRLLVALSEGFGRLTPIMESFCQLCAEEGQP